MVIDSGFFGSAYTGQTVAFYTDWLKLKRFSDGFTGNFKQFANCVFTQVSFDGYRYFAS